MPRAPVTSPTAYVGQWRGFTAGGGELRGRAGAVDRAARAAADILERSTGLAQRPPGQLRLLTEPELTAPQRTIANLLTNVVDPDGTLGRRESLRRLVTRAPAED
jgi:hypothetical protein